MSRFHLSLFSKVFSLRQRPVRVTAIGAATLMAMTTMAAADEQGLYGRLYGGLATVSGLSFADPATADLDLDGGSGLTFGGAVGVKTRSGFRAEIDLTLSEADLDGGFVENVQVFVPCGEISQSPCLDGRVDGEFEGRSAFAMGFYEFDTGSAFTPYIGGGLGLYDVEIEATTAGALNDADTIEFVLLDDSDSKLAYRLAAGFAYDVGAFDVTADYSWTRTGKSSLDGQGAFVTFDYESRANVHQFTVGARYFF